MRRAILIAGISITAACADTRPPAPINPDAGPRAATVTKADATRVVQRFLAGLQSADRTLVSETLLATRLAEAIERPPAPPLGAERHAAFRDALATEIIRDDWRALYAGASIAGVETRKPPHPVVVVLALDGGALRRAEVASENGQPLIVRIY